MTAPWEINIELHAFKKQKKKEKKEENIRYQYYEKYVADQYTKVASINY